MTSTVAEPGAPRVWADGRLVPPETPVASALDRGLTVGDGVFETFAATDGVPFALTRHLERLVRSARGLGLLDPDLAAVRAGVAAVLPAGTTGRHRVRVTVTAGPGPLGSARPARPVLTHLVVATALPAADPSADPAGIRAARVPWPRNERSPLSGIKSTSYAENVLALAEARRRGAEEALLANTVGELCEGSASNVVLERDGQLLTPPLSAGCLAGVTRELLLAWAPADGIPLRVAEPGELRFADLDAVGSPGVHLAVSGSVRGLIPVVDLDAVAVAPGPLTLAARASFARRAGADPDP